MIITSEKKLNIFFNHFKNKSLICLDTEFERKNTYFANLSFISVTDGNKFFIFDLVKYPNYLNGLKKILKKNILKILHGSSQDIEIFIKNKIPYEPFFDTQIASGFLGMDKNISYANIVKKYFKIILNKDLQNQNWLKRPVSNKTLSYLKNDVKYLKKIYLKQVSELKKKKKLTFVKEEFDYFNKNIKKNNGINTKFRKSLDKNIYLNSNFLDILKIRENEAIKRNMPKNWIIKDETLIKLIKINNLNDLKKNNLLNSSQKNEISKLILKLKKINKTNKKDIIEIKALEFFRFLISKKYQIDENLICTKYNFENYKKIKNQSKWRKKIFFDPFVKFFSGSSKIKLNKFIKNQLQN